MASRKAMSSLERLPQAQARAIAKSASERIFDSTGEFRVAQVLRAIDVVEEVVEPRPQKRGEAAGELPGGHRLQSGREGEEGLPLQLVVAGEVAREVDE